MSFACPSCGEKLTLRSTSKMTPLLTRRYYICTNHLCSRKSVSSYEELSDKEPPYTHQKALTPAVHERA